jgi:hypothetical protein
MPKRNKSADTVDGDELRERYADADESTEFSDTEIRWLQDHSIAAKGDFDPQPVVFLLPDGTEVSNDPAFGAMQVLENDDAFQKLVESRAKEMAKDLVRQEMQLAGRANEEYHGNAVNEPRTRGSVSHPPDNSAAGEGDDEMPDDYNDWGVKDLRAEIAARNEDRDEESQMPLTGNKDALVAVLEADDQ